jgi:hypothetical protein
MLLVSFRYRADDQFWFTVFHEIGHLLLHQAQTFVDDSNTPEDRSEQEANDFAKSVIIPIDRAAEFEDMAENRESILRFSVSIGVAPGLTVGHPNTPNRHLWARFQIGRARDSRILPSGRR